MPYTMRTLAVLLLTVTLTHAALPPAETDSVRRWIKERNFTEAEAAASRLVTSHPENAHAHALLGDVLLAREDGKGAVQAFARAAQLAPDDSEIHRGLGDAYASAVDTAGLLAKFGMAKKCLAAYERATELDPVNHAARFNLIGFYAGAPGLYGGSRTKAWAHAVELKNLDVLRGHLAYGMLYGSEKKLPQATTEFEEALKLDPANYLALYQIGRLAVLTGEQLDRGMSALQQALALPADTGVGAPGHDAAHWRLGMLHELKGDRAAAKAAYESALRLNPRHEKAAAALAKLD